MLRHPVFAALELARDPGRGRQILAQSICKSMVANVICSHARISTYSRKSRPVFVSTGSEGHRGAVPGTK